MYSEQQLLEEKSLIDYFAIFTSTSSFFFIILVLNDDLHINLFFSHHQ